MQVNDTGDKVFFFQGVRGKISTGVVMWMIFCQGVLLIVVTVFKDMRGKFLRNLSAWYLNLMMIPRAFSNGWTYRLEFKAIA